MSTKAKNDLMRYREEMEAAGRQANEQCVVCIRQDCAEIEARMRAGVPLGVIVESLQVDARSARLHRDEHLRSGPQIGAPRPGPAAPNPLDDVFTEMTAILKK